MMNFQNLFNSNLVLYNFMNRCVFLNEIIIRKLLHGMQSTPIIIHRV